MKKIATLGYRIKWIFFATSHDKSPCDRVCGLVKRHAAKRSLNQINFSGTGKETLGGVHNHLWNCFPGETLFQVHKAVTISYHYHYPKLHTSYRLKTSLMLKLMILIFPQLSNCVISDQWHVWYAFMSLFGG